MECAAICSDCIWDKPISPLVPYLNEKLEEQDGGCQHERHELLNKHWRLLGYMKNVREAYAIDQAKIRAARERAEKKSQEAH